MNALAELKGVSQSQYATGALYAGLIGLALSDLIPTPADAFYFRENRKLASQVKLGQLDIEDYLEKNANAYYLYNSGWYALVVLATIYTQGGIENKAFTLGAMIAGGAIASYLITNIHKQQASPESNQ